MTEESSLILARLDDLARQLDGQVSSPWLTTTQTAQYLRCSRRKIEELTRKGLLSYRRLDPTYPQSLRLYHRKDLTAFLITGRNPHQHPPSLKEKRLVEELL